DSPGAVSGASPSSADAAAAVEAQQRLSQELAAAQARVNQLTASNSELKALLYRSQQQQQQQASATSKSQANTANSEDEAQQLPPELSVDQLESERNALLKTVEELKANAAAEAASPSDAAAVPHVSRAEFEEMQRARRQLEEKFHQAMDRVAQLQDEKERLEHTLMQLEIETETIGEYLHQRELEKEASLTQLAAEKEQMRLKLSELETLVRNLMHSQPQQQLHQLQKLASQSPDSSTDAAAESLHQQRPVMEGVHTSFSNPQNGSSEEPPVQQQSLAANRILDIISQLHDDATKDSVHVMQCSCCHGSVIDL
uniref:GOLGA2L5 domain-containing protein n=1 Tax=Macrostomum lignano TaxID=282301 RepID=A0A1I8F941_9PLAT